MSGFETSKFGDGTDTGSGGNVTTSKGTPHNYFGARQAGGSVGVLLTDGTIDQLRIVIDYHVVNEIGGPLVATYLPAGATIRDVYWDTVTAFDLSGTSPTILVGTATSEVTNGLVISEAVAESTNTARLTSTLTGTWAVNTPIQARTKIGIVLGGTNPVMASQGKGILTIEYWRPNLGV